jgi:DNA-binding transcriptional ArsR family regulator
VSPPASIATSRGRRAGERAVALEQLFHALADPTRLGMVERLSRGPASVKELAEPLAMALPSVMKHLRVMERGGLVRSKKTGRVRVYQLRPPALSAIDGWLSERRAALNDQFDRLDQLLAEESNAS